MKKRLLTAIMLFFLIQKMTFANPIDSLFRRIDERPLMLNGLAFAAIGLKLTYVGYLAILEDNKHPWEERGTLRYIVLPGVTAYNLGLMLMFKGPRLYSWFYSNR